MPSLKSVFTVFVVLVVISALFSVKGFLDFKAEKEKKIALLIEEKAALQAENVEITKRSREIEEQNAALRTDVQDKESAAAGHLARVRQLEDDLKVARVNAFTASTPAEYKVKIAQFYPEMNKSDWAVIQTVSNSGRKRNYLKVPLGMADAFMFHQTRAENLSLQKGELTDVIKLKDQIIELKDQINELIEEKATIYREGYDKAYTSYMAANKDFIELLKKPNFEVKIPRMGTVLGATLLGVLLGVGL